MSVPTQRYNSIAIILHWIMAVAFILMLTSGVIMNNIEIPQKLKFNMYQWHKSLGIILLVAFFIRITWRIFHKPPQFPAFIKGAELKLAKLGHWGLYLFMFALPFVGWVLVSSSPYGLPTMIFGWFEWPHIPAIAGNDMVHKIAEEAHWILAYLFLACILAHILAVIKHAVIDKNNILKRMWWSK